MSDQDYGPGQWSPGPLGGHGETEGELSPAAQAAAGEDPFGLTQPQTAEPDDEGDRHHDAASPASESGRDREAAPQEAPPDTPPEQRSDLGTDQLGLTGQTGPSSRGGLVGDQTDLGADRQGSEGLTGPASPAP